MGVPYHRSVKDASIEFLERHLETSFVALATRRLILEVEWLENPARAYAITSKEDDLEIESNLIILFPPFSA